ncbi:hypothetical protein GWK08_06285 [Leptobacterium flavescens]|uniref:Uncharacterized protein n=1 Tax=Leptobacterium flavescens TaxID=472055 RepID=A0A6P0UMG6_9FLAO|nr:hypothetical protein [Leptobacterium flavescens]NER13039.1 hypothetical protein [Leptobacterium flavescens]
MMEIFEQIDQLPSLKVLYFLMGFIAVFLVLLIFRLIKDHTWFKNMQAKLKKYKRKDKDGSRSDCLTNPDHNDNDNEKRVA